MRQLLPTYSVTLTVTATVKVLAQFGFVAILAMGSLTACGQKNGLYLPQNEKAPARPASSGEPAPSGQS
jgi:predicted small lipoprotein YifL